MLLVQSEGISFKYESQTEDLLREVRFRIDSRSRIGVVGKNGCGKSTLIKILLGELRPRSGQLQLTSNLRIGCLRQLPVAGKGMTVEDYIWAVDPVHV